MPCPLRMVAGVVGLVGLLSFARGVYVGLHGSQAADTGLHAQLYCGGASQAAAVLAMTMLWMVVVQEADRALYRAKAVGRDRVVDVAPGAA